MSRLTKVYPNGNVTLDASQFPPIAQNVLDSEIVNSEPIKAAIPRYFIYINPRTQKRKNTYRRRRNDNRKSDRNIRPYTQRTL